MAFGDGADDEALRSAWAAFCGRLSGAGDLVFKDVNPATPLHRADGFRFLTQNLGQAFDLAVETKDTRSPAFHRFVTPTRKLGSDCADAVYQQAWIDGASCYRVWGRKGTARLLEPGGARGANRRREHCTNHSVTVPRRTSSGATWSPTRKGASSSSSGGRSGDRLAPDHTREPQDLLPAVLRPLGRDAGRHHARSAQVDHAAPASQQRAHRQPFHSPGSPRRVYSKIELGVPRAARALGMMRLPSILPQFHITPVARRDRAHGSKGRTA